jgi:MFS family permease
MTDHPPSKYRWYILALGVATHMFVVAMPWMGMPVLFKEISVELGFNLVQIGFIWGMTGLPYMVGSFAAGLASDKYGATRTLGVACLLVGIAGALRGVADGFFSLSAFMFLFGLFSIPLGMATHKAAGQWFPGHQLGLANGILATGMGVGNAVGAMISATVLSPWLGGWRNLMFVYGAVGIAVGFLWLKARQGPGAGTASPSAQTVPFRQALSRVIRLRSVWLLALLVLFICGYNSGLVGYLPLYLRSIGWSPVSADGALAAYTAASVVGAIPMSLLSDRVGSRKAVLYPAILAIIISVSLLSAFRGPVVWFSAIVAGSVQEAFWAISITLTMETGGVGAVYAGTAMGLTMTFSGIGGFFSPPIGNRLAEINPSLAFIFWLALAVAALLIIRFVKETGWKKTEIHPGGKAPHIT